MISGTLSLEWAIDSAPPDPGNPIGGNLDLTWQILSPAPAFTAISGTLPITWAIYDENSITAVLTDAPTGLVGSLTVSLTTEDGAIVVGATTAGIAEIPVGAGRYVATLPLVDPGRYYVIWTDGVTYARQLLVVSISGFIEARGGVRVPIGA